MGLGAVGSSAPAFALDLCPRPWCHVTCFENRIGCRGCGSLPPGRVTPACSPVAPRLAAWLLWASVFLSSPNYLSVRGFRTAPPDRGLQTRFSASPWLTLTMTMGTARGAPPSSPPLGVSPASLWLPEPLPPVPKHFCTQGVTPLLPTATGMCFPISANPVLT